MVSIIQKLKSKLNVIKQISLKISEDHISEYAATCAYFTILSFIPFLILLLTLIQYVNIDKEAVIQVVQKNIPSIADSVILDIIQEAYSKTIGVVSVSAITILWSAGKGFSKLGKGLCEIYKTKKDKHYIFFRARGVICTVIFIVFIILSFVLVVFGNRINEIARQSFPSIYNITSLLIKFKNFWIYIALFVAFLFMYKYIPSHRVKLKMQIPGALFAAVLWYIISYIFSVYVNVFTGFSVIYGSLTAIILTMMWIYSCMYIILLGAEINVVLYNYSKK